MLEAITELPSLRRGRLATALAAALVDDAALWASTEYRFGHWARSPQPRAPPARPWLPSRC